MKKFWRGFRKSNYRDENKLRIRTEQRDQLQQLLLVGGHEAEGEYVELLKQWIPGLKGDELKEKIRQFHDAVNERQARERGSR